MGKSVDEIVVGGNGSIYTAPLGTTIPASINAPLGAGWRDAGYVTEDGVTFTDGKSLESVRAWQSLHDLRRFVSSKETMVSYSLMQWSGENVKLAYGGGEVEEVAPAGETTPAAYRYTPPDPAHIEELMHAIEWEDGDHDFRLILPRGMVTENVESNISRQAAGLLPITFSVLGTDGVDPFILDTNHPAWASAVGS